MKGANKNQTKLFRDLIRNLEPSLRNAFLKAVQDMRANINWQALNRALRARNIEAAVEALGIDAAYFAIYYKVKTDAFFQGGQLAVSTINQPRFGKIRFSFDITNPRAEAWIRDNAAKMVVDTTEEIKASARQVIEDGYNAGRHPNDIARDLGGRMVGGRREGGVVGLNRHLAGHVESMRARLESGDPLEMGKVLSMQRRDHRLDKQIIDAIKDGKKLSKEAVGKMLDRYQDRLKAYRAELIARTETGMAVMGGRAEEWHQAAEKSGLPVEAVEKTWIHGGGVKDPREDHQAMNGTTVRGLDAVFIFGTVTMKHALDANGGAKHCAHCTCDTQFYMDHSWGLT